MNNTKKISVKEFKELLENRPDDETVDYVNVCTPAEYKEGRIAGVRNVPLDEIEKCVLEIKDKDTVYLHCRSGARAQKAIERLERQGVHTELVNVEGGQLAWEAAGYPLESDTPHRIPMMRQVMITAGSLVLVGVILSLIWHPWAVYLALFVGAGMLFAGLTGWCGMAFLLSKMPWNQ